MIGYLQFIHFFIYVVPGMFGMINDSLNNSSDEILVTVKVSMPYFRGFC